MVTRCGGDQAGRIAFSQSWRRTSAIEPRAMTTQASLSPAISGSAAGPMLEISNLTVRYGPITAARGVSLEVHQGEVVTLLGANGAGKSSKIGRAHV